MQLVINTMSSRKRRCGNRRRSDDRFHGRKEVLDAIRLAIETNEGEGPIHPLYCVSDKLYDKIKANAVIVHQFERLPNESVPNGITKYKISSMGVNVERHINKSSSAHPIDLRNVKHQYVVILCPKEDMLDNPSVHFVGSTSSSRFILLLCACFRIPSSMECTERNQVEMFRKVKNNMTKCATTKHFNSTGKIFGHGVNARFTMEHGILYGSYCCKKTRTAAGLEKESNIIMSHYVSSSVQAIERIIPKVVSATTLSLKVMEDMDTEMHRIARRKYGLVTDGIKELGINFRHYISAHFNSNADTEVAHTELDMVYTLLGVPAQDKATTIAFFIQITGKKNFWFKMIPGFHILYSAHFLTHRQRCSKIVKDGNINISAYTPKRLFHNFAKTYERLTSEQVDENVTSESSNEEASGDETELGLNENIQNELLAFAAFLTGCETAGSGRKNYFSLLDEYKKKRGC